jgi:hypothetical protein
MSLCQVDDNYTPPVQLPESGQRSDNLYKKSDDLYSVFTFAKAKSRKTSP